MDALVAALQSSGSEKPEETAELLVSEAAADLPTFLARTRLGSELRERVQACAHERLLQAPAVSFAALDRARGTIDDFARTYLPLHNLGPAEIVRFLPELAFVEAMIYAMDEDNERQAARLGPDPSEWRFESESALLGVLHARGLIDDDIRFHLQCGKTYWALERTICRAMLRGERLDESEWLRAHELKSFDYRLLDCLLYKLTGTSAEPALGEFLRVDEYLTDIADDLYDYEDDVVQGSFNVYRCFIHAYGVELAPTRLAERIGALERQHKERLAALSPSAREAFARRMGEVFERPGTRSWQIPAPIADEAAFRESVHREDESQSRGTSGQAASQSLPQVPRSRQSASRGSRRFVAASE